jgi:ATPase family associated with various cellular activities (AAA)
MNRQLQEFATRPALIRNAIAVHREWIETKLGVSLSEAVIFDGLENLSEVGLEKILSVADIRRSFPAARRLRTFTAHAELPPQYAPIIAVRKQTKGEITLESLLQDDRASVAGFEWIDCPIAVGLHYYNTTIIAMNVRYHSRPGCLGESVARILIARRDSATRIAELIELLHRHDQSPRLHTLHGQSRRIAPARWDDIVVDANVTSLLKNDFETFWQRKSWSEQHNLPFRRGYLLHGPPGNGKTSAIRAMMTSRGLNAYTLRFFDPQTEDSDLDDVFERAHRDRPAMVLLKDIDRAFPKTGESGNRISLQQLLNCLDGVATGEGIVVAATANEPAVLDPAILRRPGRFDRVVHIPNPTAELRREYFCRLNGAIEPDRLQQPVQESAGFSFAQLRECHITAGQRAFERGDAIREEDLLAGIRTLREGMVNSSRHGNAAGFRSSEGGAA